MGRFLILALVALVPASPAWSEELLPADRLLFVLEYIGADYGAAVREGNIDNPFEYEEMIDLSGLLVEQFDVLRRHGASDDVRVELLQLQDQIRRLQPWDDVRSTTTRLVSALQEQLDVVTIPVAAPDLLRGETLYGSNCAPCHGSGGEGGLGPGLRPSSFIQARSDEELIAFILAGREGSAMDSFEDILTEEELANVVFIMRAWQE